MSISSLEVRQEWGLLHGGTWRTLRVPDRRLGIYLVDPKDHILKVLCHYIFVGGDIRVCYHGNKNVRHRHTHRHLTNLYKMG